MELLLGCGRSRVRLIQPGHRPPTWTKLVTLDMDPACGPDVVADFDVDPLPFADNAFDEVHAYEVLEHLGTQGDFRSFFRHFAELYRVLKPSGVLCATTPHWNSVWTWSDPGHRRVITPATLVFLNQAEYVQQGAEGRPMTDYRWLWKGDFRLVWVNETDERAAWMLQAFKSTEQPTA